MELATGHHGKPPLITTDGSCAFALDDIQAVKAWMTDLCELFEMDHFPEQCSDKQWRKTILNRASWPLAGLIVLADWLGSDRKTFPFKTVVMPLKEYWQQALKQAEHVVSALPNAARCAEFHDVQSLFPYISQPTPLQQLATALPITGNEPELFILEDVTGAGKTEAALILSNRLMANGKGDGLYIGLPTMATANAMFDRLQESYRKLFTSDNAPSLMLAHGARELNSNFRQAILKTETSSDQSEYTAADKSANASCDRWFADSRKKALLAEVGVGTLDQALMSVLPFRHQSLRMLGLHKKILILDEVHAYDAYMNKLLERLLEFHASQGGSAIILSATLTQEQRSSLIDAYAHGCGQEPQEINSSPDYPWLSHFSAGKTSEYPVDSRREVSRAVSVDWLHQESDCLEQIRFSARKGHCIAWIRNTVDDAIRAYKALADEFGPEQLVLFHSRFAFGDRLAIEDLVIGWCGKKSTPDNRHGKIVISTQVIEQSMDLDFDLMFTDLAPIDLLVQRAGRLQRHIRDAKGNRFSQPNAIDERPSPRLQILAPLWNESPDSLWLQRSLSGTAAVYPDHGRLWLGQQLLQRLGMIRMPEDARMLVEDVYGLDAHIPEGLQSRADSQQGKEYSERASANQLLLDISKGYQDSAGRWQEEIDISTRLGEPTTQLYLARKINNRINPYFDGSFCWEMSRLQIRETMWHKVKEQIPHLFGDELIQVQTDNRLPPGEIVLLPEGDCSFYSAQFGFQPKGDA